MDKLDQALVERLSRNGRESVTSLASALGVTRATVQERMKRLEQQRIIDGYSIRYHPEHQRQRVSAFVIISAAPRSLAAVSKQIAQFSELESLHSVSGIYDLVALLNCESTAQLETEIDRLAAIEGVEKTLTNVVLSRSKETFFLSRLRLKLWPGNCS